MQDAWRRACKHAPHFLLIAGEAGIGKSRLAEELLVWAQQQGFAAARTRAYAAEGRLAYAPIIEWLRSETLRVVLAHLGKVWLTEVSAATARTARRTPRAVAAHAADRILATTTLV